MQEQTGRMDGWRVAELLSSLVGWVRREETDEMKG